MVGRCIRLRALFGWTNGTFWMHSVIISKTQTLRLDTPRRSQNCRLLPDDKVRFGNGLFKALCNITVKRSFMAPYSGIASGAAENDAWFNWRNLVFHQCQSFWAWVPVSCKVLLVLAWGPAAEAPRVIELDGVTQSLVPQRMFAVQLEQVH